MVTKSSPAEVIELVNQLGEEKTVQAGKCFVDSGYGRPLNEEWRKRLTASFAPILFGRPILSARKDGTYAIIDGQHRVAALREKEGPGVNFKALVLSNLSKEDEAWLFARYNADRKSLSAADILKAEYESGHKTARDIVEIVHDNDCRIMGIDFFTPTYDSKHGGAPPKRILAVATVRQLYDRSPITLKNTLYVLGEAWGDQYNSMSRTNIRAVGEFTLRYKADYDRVIAKMKEHTPADLKREIAVLTGYSRSGDSDRHGAVVIAKWYNHGLKSNRLKLGAAFGDADSDE